MKEIFRITCKVKNQQMDAENHKLNTIVKTIFNAGMPIPNSSRRNNQSTITTESVSRFKPHIFVNGRLEAKDVCAWLNENNPNFSYLCEKVGYDCDKSLSPIFGYDELPLFSMDLEERYVYQRTFGFNVQYVTGIPLFKSAESFFSAAMTSLDENDWKWELGVSPVLVRNIEVEEQK